MANVFFNTLVSVILSPLLSLIIKNQGIILCLHSVKKQTDTSRTLSRMAITDSFLECMILHFKRQNIPIITLEDALKKIGQPITGPFVSITFDDGYRDNYTDAYPVFLKHKVPFTIFLTTGLIDQTIPMWWDALEKIIDDNNQLKFKNQTLNNLSSSEKNKNYSTLSNIMRSCSQPEMIEYLKNLINENETSFTFQSTYGHALTWDMINTMHSSGLAHFGAHSVTHRLFSTLSKTELYTEIAVSKQRIEAETGIELQYFAYPFGQPDEIGVDAPELTENLDFRAAFTTTRKALNRHILDNMYTIPRVMIGRGSQNILKLQVNLSCLTTD